jgi:hypothetical protein
MAKSQFSGFNILVQDAIPLKEEDFASMQEGTVKEVTPSKTEGILRIPGKDNPVNDEQVETLGEDLVEVPTGVENADVKVPKDKKTPDKQNETPDDTNAFQAFASFLDEKGILDIGDKKIESEDDLTAAWQDSVGAGVENWKSALGTDAQKFIEYLEQGGDPQMYIQKKASFSYLKTTDAQVQGDETIQKNILRDLLTREGYDLQEITDKVKDYEDSGLLEKESMRAFKKLKGIEAQEDNGLVESQKQENVRRQEAYKGYLNTLQTMINGKSDIAGFPISENQKKSLYEYMTRPATEINGQPATKLQADINGDPDGQLKMAWLYMNKFDFTKFKKKAESSAASGLKERLGRFTDSREKSSRQLNDSNEKVDMNIFKKNLNI